MYCAQCNGISEGLQFWRGDIGCNKLANDSCRVSHSEINWNLREDATANDLKNRYSLLARIKETFVFS